MTLRRPLVLGSACLAAPALAEAPRPPVWPDTFPARLEALALIQTLNAALLMGPSATLVLERWCADHRLAADPRIVARPVPGAARAPTPEQRRRLDVADDEPVRHRRVQLVCGELVLSEADNWYVPGRLTPEMNRQLETTDTPFGRVVRPLTPSRRTLGVEMRWEPLPAGWEQAPRPDPCAAPAGALALPEHLFGHRALLSRADGQPIAEVHEAYTSRVLAFSRPPGRPDPLGPR